MAGLNIIIDFDSTIVSVESLEELAEISLKDAPDRTERLEKIKQVTNDAMEGRIGFGEALRMRLELFSPTREGVEEVGASLVQHISSSFLEHRDFFEKNGESIYVISGGMENCIIPTIEHLNLKVEHLFSNRLVFNASGAFVGVDESRPLAHVGGKVEQIRKLGLTGTTVVLGDGMTDYEIKEAGCAEAFYVYTEHIERAPVVEKAEASVTSFNQFLELLETRHDFTY